MNGKKTGFLQFEKRFFPWRAHGLLKGRPAVFPGCNAVFFMPRTVERLLDLLGPKGYGWMYDCCGKPLEGANGEGTGIRRIEDLIQAYGITEISTFCPNCWSYLNGKLSVPVVSIYAVLQREGIPCQHPLPEGVLFIPCPDRPSGQIADDMRGWTGHEYIRRYSGACCGLGNAGQRNAAGMLEQIRNQDCRMIPYCASCYSQFQQHGIPHSGHVLSEALGVREAAITAVSRLLNRLRPKRWSRGDGTEYAGLKRSSLD